MFGAHHREFSVKRMCRVLEISRSGYYDWHGRKKCGRSQLDRVLLTEIRKIHQDTKEAYGAIKTWRGFKEAGIGCGKHRVARLRRQAAIEARRKRKFRVAYQARHNVPPAPKLVKWPFHADHRDRIWMADVTFIPTRQGWLYLAVLIDLFSRLIVGWAMKDRPNQELVNQAFSWR